MYNQKKINNMIKRYQKTPTLQHMVSSIQESSENCLFSNCENRFCKNCINSKQLYPIFDKGNVIGLMFHIDNDRIETLYLKPL